MAVIRINAARDGTLMLAGGQRDWGGTLDAALGGLMPDAPLIVVVHGYRYAPGDDGRSDGPNCPHGLLYRSDEPCVCQRARRPPLAAWPRALGFSEHGLAQGLCVAFGWDGRRDRLGALLGTGRNDFAHVYEGAGVAGRALARILGRVGQRHPGGSA